MHAFRCKACGHLEPAAHAGENALPHACSVCAAGVRFSPKGAKEFDPGNWEVLADADPKRLAELGLSPKSVTRHVPVVVTSPANGRSVAATASEGAAKKDTTK